MIKAGIIGGDGYATGELIRLLLNHPDVDLKWVQNQRLAGCDVASVHQGLIGEIDMHFTAETRFEEIDVIFLCLGSGESRRFLEQHAAALPEDLRIVDLSPDFQFDEEHGFLYGLPEINRKYIIRGKRTANPGSIATAVLLALLPLARNLLLNSDIHVNVISGCTEEGIEPSTVSRFPWRNENVTLYKPLKHPQLNEIQRMLASLQTSFDSKVNLIAMQGGFSRGTLLTAYIDCPIELSEIRKLYESYYDDHNFTFVSDRMPDLKDVVNTNKCILHLSKEDGKLLVVAALDNLMKGGAGQAVHNMNLLFGLHERVGLQIKASAF